MKFLCHLHNPLIIAGLLLSFTSLCSADSMNLNQVLQATLSDSPSVRKLEANLAKQQGEAISLETLENPELSIETKPYTSNPQGSETAYEISVSQPLRASTLARRARVANLMRRAANEEQRATLLELQQKATLLYARAWAQQQLLDYTKQSLTWSRQLAALMEEGHKNGTLPESASTLFQAEAQRLLAELQGIEADKRRAFAELTQLSKLSFSAAALDKPELPALPEKLDFREIDSWPSAQRLKALSALSTAQRELAALDSIPGLTPRIGFEHTEDGGDRIIAGFSIALPLWDRNQATRHSASAEEISRKSNLEYAQSPNFSEELAQLLEAVRSRESQAQRYATVVLPALNKALSASQRELQSGQGNALQIWQILKELSSAQERYIEIWVAQFSLRAELSSILGREI